MNGPVHDPLSRRDFVQRGLVLGGLAFAGGSLLTGCQSAPAGNSAALPGPEWPNESFSPPVSRVPAAPAPVPVVGPPKNVIPRSAWAKAGPKMSMSKPMNGIQRITIHHDATNSSGLRGQSAVARRLESIRQYHRSRGSTWVDIGYHYIVDPEGRVWEGRSLSIEGAHVKATNEHNLGVMLLGNFNIQRPTGAQISTLNGFVRNQMSRYRVATNRLYTHRELNPSECPGTNLQAYMEKARSRGGPLVLG